ncbi:unnamed protein product [Caretta caretta]
MTTQTSKQRRSCRCWKFTRLVTSVGSRLSGSRQVQENKGPEQHIGQLVDIKPVLGGLWLGAGPCIEHGADRVHDDLVTWDSALLSPESSMGTDERQQQEPNEASKVKEQLQHILGPYLEELFEDPLRNGPLQNKKQKWKRQKLPWSLVNFCLHFNVY